MDNLKRIVSFVIMALMFVVLIGKISNWFLDYSDETNRILDTVMFCFIGIGFLFGSWVFDKKIPQILFAICGIYLVAMNFIPDFNGRVIIGICCLLIPMIIIKFSPDEGDADE